MKKRDAEEAQALLGRVLDAVHTGYLAADGPAATAVAHRLEGALLALRAAGGAPSQGQPGSRDAGR